MFCALVESFIFLFALTNVNNEQPLQPLDSFEEPPKPPIELKPLPSHLCYVYLNNDPNTPVIISDKLYQEETSHLIIVLEKHR